MVVGDFLDNVYRLKNEIYVVYNTTMGYIYNAFKKLNRRMHKVGGIIYFDDIRFEF